MEKSEYIAHTIEGSSCEPQLLKEHLIQVAELAKAFGTAFDAGEVAYLCGLYHDVGKYSREFQSYIRGALKKRVDHSTAGAQLLQKGVVPAFCIAGHHAGLPDLGGATDMAGTSTLGGRLKKSIPDYSQYQKELPAPGPHAMPEAFQKILGKQEYLQAMLYIRMVFSCLVDADFLDTERYMSQGSVQRGGFDSIEELAQLFFDELAKKGYLHPQNALNEKRCQILRRCMEEGKKQPGLYTLTVPTGGGKTISSMAFAMAQVQAWKKRRVIYVIPYTSIIEQTADVFRSFLPDKDIIEHHSQVTYDDDGDRYNAKKLATENWDAPVIVTTNVQFFESLFANKTSRCRKLHNIAESVIIFDEAQMIPAEFLRPIIKAIEYLTQDYGCSAVLCSATQPALDQMFQKEGRPVSEIMDHIPELYSFFQRVQFRDEGTVTYEEIAEALSKRQQVLCVVTTKKEADAVYKCMKGKDIFYLSTNLYPAHRRRVIADIKERLKTGKPCRVVSTSVISVGVDIDFPEVFLEMTGLDSLIQGAGRCNREGKRPLTSSIAHVFQTENNKKSSFMKQEKQITEGMIRQADEVTAPESIHSYFQRLFYNKGDDALDKKDIIHKAQRMSFAQMASEVKLISTTTKAVLIPHEPEAIAIAEKLKQGIRSRKLMREAGQYIVNVRCSDPQHPYSLFDQLCRAGKIEMFPGDSEMAYLVDESIYDDTKGLVYEEKEGEGIIL